MRTTIDLESPVLEELKRVQQEEGVSLGKLASRLLADALDFRRKKIASPSKLSWNTGRMGALVDLTDKDAVHRVLDQR
jgi:predicted DNA-binding ribbon-helix-helix protein